MRIFHGKNVTVTKPEVRVVGYVVEHLGDDGLKRQLSIADTLDCLNPEQVVADWIDEYHLEQGSFDVTMIDHRFTDKYPTDLQMGKVDRQLQFKCLLRAKLCPDPRFSDGLILMGQKDGLYLLY